MSYTLYWSPWYTSFLETQKVNSAYIENQHMGTYYKYSLVCPRKRPRSIWRNSHRQEYDYTEMLQATGYPVEIIDWMPMTSTGPTEKSTTDKLCYYARARDSKCQ